MLERVLWLIPLLMTLASKPTHAAVNDYYFGDYYTYKKAESYESALGGHVALLQPAGIDYFPTTWLPAALLLEGPITVESLGVISRLLKSTPNIRSIYLNSPGGDLLAGMQIGRLIFEAKLRTVVNFSAQCQSACSLAFLAGHGRLMLADETEFGFHRQYYVVDGEIRYGPWAKDVKQINGYLSSIESKSITAEEIVGTTGQASMSQARLEEKGITTTTRDVRTAATIATVKPQTPYERFRVLCHTFPATDACKKTEPLLREPAIAQWAEFKKGKASEEGRKRLLSAFAAFNEVYANATPEKLFDIDCKETTPSFPDYLSLRIAEISLSLSADRLKSFEGRRNGLVRRCAAQIGGASN